MKKRLLPIILILLLLTGCSQSKPEIPEGPYGIRILESTESYDVIAFDNIVMDMCISEDKYAIDIECDKAYNELPPDYSNNLQNLDSYTFQYRTGTPETATGDVVAKHVFKVDSRKGTMYSTRDSAFRFLQLMTLREQCHHETGCYVWSDYRWIGDYETIWTLQKDKDGQFNYFFAFWDDVEGNANVKCTLSGDIAVFFILKYLRGDFSPVLNFNSTIDEYREASGDHVMVINMKSGEQSDYLEYVIET